MIEVRYAGVVVGRSAIIRELDARGLFLGMNEPLPVGTPVWLKIGDRAGAEAVAGKVEVVSESHELALAGMRVRFADPHAASLFGTPAEPAPEPAPTAASMAAVDDGPTSAAGGDAATASTAGPGPPQPPPPAAVPLPASSVATEPASLAGQVAMASDSPTAGRGPIDSDLEPPPSEPDQTGRIPAPNPDAFAGPGGGKKGRRNRRR